MKLSRRNLASLPRRQIPHTLAATPSPTQVSLTSSRPIPALRSRRKTFSTMSTACCTRPTIANAMRTISAKELPRIPRVKTAADFWAFSKAGRDLADLHLNYETVPMYADAKIDSGGKTLTDADYRVEKMKYGKRGKDKDLTTLIYNAQITVTGIPLAAYDYVVNGKPALDWVVERQCVKTDKDSGIVNDANDWAIETMNNPRYPLELFLRVITVSLETMKIVRSRTSAGHPAELTPPLRGLDYRLRGNDCRRFL